jgi:pyrroloquinoline-quinone synthase
MEVQEFFDQLEQSIAHYDLLRHPFYQAWSRGELTGEDLQEYAKDYYHHVESFPRCLAQFSRRLEQSELRQVVLANLHDELGGNTQRSHAEFWLDFAEGIGAGRSLLDHDPPSQIRVLISFFKKVAKEGALEEALAAFYAYESQVPRISREKWRGLTEKYRVSDHTCSYFILHMTADVYHARMWREQLAKRISVNPATGHAALAAAEAAVLHLWEALTGIQSACLERSPQVL